MLELMDALTGHLSIDEFFLTAIWASIIISVVSIVLEPASTSSRRGERTRRDLRSPPSWRRPFCPK